MGASDSPCSETYAGSAPNSEPEAKAVSDYLLGTLGSWDLFWTLHTYGQLYMSPYGYTIDLPDNYPAMVRPRSCLICHDENAKDKSQCLFNNLKQ